MRGRAFKKMVAALAAWGLLACGGRADILLEGEYPGHLQDVFMSGDAIWWAHTEHLLKTDRSGRVVVGAAVGGHHAGLDMKDGRLYAAVCAFNGEPRGSTTPQCHVMVGEYDADTLVRIKMHVLDINDRAGSFCFLADGSALIGCLRHPGLAPTEVKFHHVGKDFRLIKTHVVDVGVAIPLGIEVIRRLGNDVCLFMYGGPVVKLDAKSLKVTGRCKSFGGPCGFAEEGGFAWIGTTQRDKASGMWRSRLVRRPLSWKPAE